MISRGVVESVISGSGEDAHDERASEIPIIIPINNLEVFIL